jgi:formate dehydrogenase gamma subunit
LRNIHIELIAVLVAALFLAFASPSLAEDQECLACHGQAGMKSGAGKDISIDAAKHAASVHGILGCKDCHTTIKGYPHPAKIPQVKCSQCHAEESSDVPKSIHAALGEAACESCHGNAHYVSPAAKIAPAKCVECHASEVKELGESIHGQAAKAGDPDAPTCSSCHGPVHNILSSGDPASSVSKKNLPDTCATCHSNPRFLSRHNIPIAHPVESYKQSVHGRAVAAGKNAATCSDCHGSHAIFPPRDPRSKINHWNVPKTCGQCHTEIAKTYLESIHGQAMNAGSTDAPVCTDCHGEHLILSPQNPNSPVSALRVSVDTCGHCHGDQQLNARYNLPTNRLPSFAESYHGLALREGSQTVANCASCHGVHNIFPTSDPRSTVNPANLARTCGKCHPGAGKTFAIGPVHVLISSENANPVVKWIRWIYLTLIPFTLAFMLLHNLIDLLAKMRRQTTRIVGEPKVARMNLWFRIAHWGVMLSFPILVVTGFALKYPDAWYARPLLLWEGSHFALRGLLHRIAAVILIASTIYHFIHLSVNRRDRAFLRAMLPQFKDSTDLVHVVLYNLGLRKDAPTFGKFNYAEKIEYWAFLWGTAIMALSGFLLWFNNFTLRHFAKWVADAATAVHFYEAILATFSILLWHFYITIFDPLVYPMDTAWLDGKVPAEHYRHSRPAYLRQLEEAQRESPEKDEEKAE